MTNKALTAEILQLKETVAGLQAEVRLLRRGKGRLNAESFESLLECLHDVFTVRAWTSREAFEHAEDNPALFGLLVHCLGERPEIQGLSKMLMKHLGMSGAYRLHCVDEHSRAGAKFTVTECVTASQKKSCRVAKADD